MHNELENVTEMHTIDAEIFVGEIFRGLKFSRDSIFVDGFPHENLNSMKISVVEKFYTCTMAKAVTQ